MLNLKCSLQEQKEQLNEASWRSEHTMMQVKKNNINSFVSSLGQTNVAKRTPLGVLMMIMEFHTQG